MITSKQMEKYQKIESEINKISALVEQAEITLKQIDLEPSEIEFLKKHLFVLKDNLNNFILDLSDDNQYETSFLKRIDDLNQRISDICFSSVSSEEAPRKQELTLEQREALIEERYKKDKAEEEAERVEQQRLEKERQEKIENNRRSKQEAKEQKLKSKYESEFLNLFTKALTVQSIEQLTKIQLEFQKSYEQFLTETSEQTEREIVKSLKTTIGEIEEVHIADIHTFFKTMFACLEQKFKTEITDSNFEEEVEAFEKTLEVENNQQYELPNIQLEEDLDPQGYVAQDDMVIAQKKLLEHFPDIREVELEEELREKSAKRREEFLKYYEGQSANDINNVVHVESKQTSRFSMFGAKLKQLSSSAIKAVTTSLQEMAQANSEFTPPGSSM